MPKFLGSSSPRFLWVLCVSASGILFLASCSKKEEAEVEAPAPVQVTAVTQDTIQRIVQGDGALFPENQWNVMPKVSAPVVRFLVNRGDHVQANQLLAVLENRDLVATAVATQGQVQQAQANLANTEKASMPEAIVKARTDVASDQAAADAAGKVLESRRKLYEEGALARKLVDDAAVQAAAADAQMATAKEHLRTLEAAGMQAQIEGARAQVTTAEGQLHSAQAQVAYTEIRSPGAGVVADRPLYPGDMAAAGTPLMVIMNIGQVVARVNIPANEAAPVRVGQAATVSLTDIRQDVPGRVVVVSPATDPNSSTIQVWVRIANPGEHLKPGATVHAAIVTETIKNAMLVPAAALLPGEEGGTAVLAITPDMVAHKRNVQVGVRQGDKVQLLTGVLPGEEVVTVGGMGVDDKGKVRIVENTAPEPAEDEDQPEEAPAKGGDQKKDEGKSKQK